MKSELFIDGRWIAGRGPGLDATDPGTEQRLCRLQGASAADVDLAVEAAARALPHTAAQPVVRRARLLRGIAEGLRGRAEALARLETLDVGKPLHESRLDVADAARVFDYHAELLEGGVLDERQPALDSGDYAMTVRRVPVGVAALVTAWNFPLLLAAWKLAPALAAGCATIVKPSEWASLSTLELADVAHEAGALPGQVNVLLGDGRVGATLVAHRGVRKVSFTGSGATGRRILEASVRDLRRVTLELGGKSPAIVFADADLDAATEWLFGGIFYNQGQVCSATSRLLVQRAVHAELLDRLCRRARALRLGHGLDNATQMGPLINAAQLDRVLGAIDAARRGGGRVLAGGRRAEAFERGHFVEPTVIDGVDTDNEAWRHEIFGPVLCVRAFDDEAAAVREANHSDYGLAAAVFGADLERCERVARQIEAGTVWINCAGPAMVQGPWGGFKGSGIGRELGRAGIDAYTEWQQITRAQPHPTDTRQT